MAELRKWVTTVEIAGILGVPESWVYARTYRAASDPIPYKRVGRWLRFDVAEVKAWIDDRTDREVAEKATARAEWNRPAGPLPTSTGSATSTLPFRSAPKRGGVHRK